MTIPEAQNLAAEHERAGRLAAAAEVHNNLGIAYRQTEWPNGSPEAPLVESLAAFDRAIALRPNYTDAHNNRGNTLRMLGRFDEAATAYRRAIQFDPNHAAAHANLANVFVDQGKPTDAISEYRTALRIQPDYPVACNNLANALRMVGEFAEAESICEDLLRSKANFPDAHLNLGNIFYDQEKFNEAIQSFRTAIELQPTNPVLHNNLAMALAGTDRALEAIAAAQQAVALAPNYADGFNCLGNLLADEGNYDRAAEAFQQAIRLQPNFALAHWNYAAIPLLAGNFEIGWAEHEWRNQVNIPSAPRKFPQPQWTGQDPTGATILLHAEQGFGDTIQFVRYAPLVADRRARVLLYGPKELSALLRQSFPNVEIVADPLPDFDFHCPLLSLPFIFQTRLETIPSRTPYLIAPPEKIETWKNLLGPKSGKLRVGLAWSGNPKRKLNRRRSLDPKQLAPITAVKGVEFYSLQKSGVQPPPAQLNLIDLTTHFVDFSDTAALIHHLDLVISVDTAVAHLAAALARPVWLLLSFVPAWRWMLHRLDSPWYPEMNILRQPAKNDWDHPIARAAQNLRDLVRS